MLRMHATFRIIAPSPNCCFLGGVILFAANVVQGGPFGVRLSHADCVDGAEGVLQLRRRRNCTTPRRRRTIQTWNNIQTRSMY